MDKLESNLNSKIVLANTNRYADGAIVEKYLDEPYHTVRILLAISLLTKYLKESFPGIPRKDLTVIDIGCGSGYVAELIQKKGYTVIAADYSDSVTPERKKVINTISFDASNNFPYDNHSFNAIFAGELIEHVFDIKHFLEECRRILKPQGVLILTTPNLAGLGDRIRFLFGYSPRHINPLHPYLYLHIRPFTRIELMRVLKKVGFENLKVLSNFVKIYLSENRKIKSRLLAKLLPGLGGSLISAAVKK